MSLGKLKPASLIPSLAYQLLILPLLGALIEDVRNGRVKEFAETIALKVGPKLRTGRHWSRQSRVTSTRMASPS